MYGLVLRPQGPFHTVITLNAALLCMMRRDEEFAHGVPRRGPDRCRRSAGGLGL